MVKADAYGHGAVAVARALEPESPGRIAGFAVATAEEAIELREAGIQAKILVLSPLPPEAAPVLRKYELTPVIQQRGEPPRSESLQQRGGLDSRRCTSNSIPG